MTISIDIEKACEKIRLPFIYVKRKKTYIHTKTCTQMLIEALFIIAQTGNNSECSTTGD